MAPYRSLRKAPCSLLGALALATLVSTPATAAPSASGTVALTSRVSDVTVFSDRALVTRRVETTLPGGVTTFVLSGLPAATDPASLQVSGAGAFALRDVRLSRRELARDVSAELKALEDERRGYEARLAIEQDRLREMEAERVFLAEIVKRLTSTAGASDPAPLDPAAWARMLDFHRSRHEAVNAASRAARAAATAAQAEIERLTRAIRALGPSTRTSVVEAELVLEAKAPTSARLEVSYLVRGPSWRPDYVVRADSEAATLSVQYRAMVRQNTGEDWSDATLRLSTARPQVGGSLPILVPWRLEVYQPAPTYKESAKMSRAMAAPPAPSMAGAADAYAAEAAQEPEMAYATAGAQAGATAVLFTVAGATTVESDNRDKTVTIAVLDLPVQYSYAAVPKLSPYAYFRAEAKNASDYPFLPGASHVYVDGAYVADASMGSVPPGGALKVDLGIDESVSVERRLKRRFDETTGVLTKRDKTTWEYDILIKNGKRRSLTLEVYDQLPLSQDERIVVKAIAPAYAKDTEALRKEAGETFVWRLALAPGGEASLPLAFSVDYPKGTPIVGLD